jgi:hypothetical protein
MTKNSFRTGKPEYNMTKSLWNCEFEYKVLFSNSNQRKAKTLNNMKNRRKIADKYELLSYDEKSLFVLQYCYKFATFKPSAFYAVNPILDIFSDYKNSDSEEEVVENDPVDQALNNFENELENFQYEFELTIL